MSKQEKQMTGAMRIFEALSGVDEELLIRCEDEAKKKVPIWYYGKVVAACLCFVLMGALLWGTRTIMKTAENASGSASMAPAAAAEAAMEEAACEAETALDGVVGQRDTTTETDSGNVVGEAGNSNSSLADVITESKVEDAGVAKQESIKQESTNSEIAGLEAITDLSNSKENATEDTILEGAPLDKRRKLSLEDAKTVAVLGEYVPNVIPAGYIFENAWLTEKSTTLDAERVTLCWVNGMDDIHITISYAARDIVTVDVSKTETYDVHQYEIPYASTVPQEYRTIFNNPVFAAEDFTQDIVERRMKSVADAGDTATPRGNFGVLYESGVLVEFNGDGDAESIYAMILSLE